MTPKHQLEGSWADLIANFSQAQCGCASPVPKGSQVEIRCVMLIAAMPVPYLAEHEMGCIEKIHVPWTRRLQREGANVHAAAVW